MGKISPTCRHPRRRGLGTLGRFAVLLGGWATLSVPSCAGPSKHGTQAPVVKQEQEERELLALRRENEALRRRLEMRHDRQLMESARGQGGREPANQDAVRLRPDPQAPGAASQERRPAAVSLADVPHSAPSEDMLQRYSASAAEPESSTLEPAPKRYRLVGARDPRAATPRPPAPTPQATSPEDAQGLDDKAMYAKARTLYVAGQRERARAWFRQLEARFPHSDLADNAVYWMADDDLEAGRVQQAQNGFMRVLSAYPSGNKVEDAMYKLAMCYRAQADLDGARAMLRKVARTGRKELRVQARQALATLHTSDDTRKGR